METAKLTQDLQLKYRERHRAKVRLCEAQVEYDDINDEIEVLNGIINSRLNNAEPFASSQEYKDFKDSPVPVEYNKKQMEYYENKHNIQRKINADEIVINNVAKIINKLL